MRKAMFKRGQELEQEQADVMASISALDGEIVAARAEDTVAPVNGSDAVLAAEREVIGALMRDNKVYDLVIGVLRAKDFSDSACAACFEIIGEVVEGRSEHYLVADAVMLSAQAPVAKFVSLNELQQWATTASDSESVIMTRVAMVKNAAGQRNLGAAVVRIQSIANEDRSLESKSEDILSVLAGSTEVRDLPVVSIGEAAVQALTQLAERAQSDASPISIPYGFADVDALTAGMHGGQFIVLAARPAVGKTAFALSVALNAAAAGVHVLLASMEMKAKELSKRAISIVSGVDSHSIRMGALDEQQWEKVVSAGEALGTLPFDIVDLPSVDAPGLSGLARRRHRKGEVGLIIVDYLQIMKTSGSRGLNREQQIGEISRALKELAMALDVPVIALSQLNRSVETRLVKRPQLSDLRESGAIEQDADVVIFIHREDAASKPVGDVSQAEIIVAKQRDGATGEAQVCFLRNTTAFTDYASISNRPLLRAA